MTSQKGGYKCPICQETFSDLHAIARHIALKKDEPHIAWRLKRNLPEKVAAKDRDIITQVKVEIFRNIALITGKQAKEKQTP